MPKRRALVDSDGNSTGNSWISSSDDEGDEDSFRALLATQDDSCPECGFDGPLRSTRKGYKCPRCKALVIPSE